MVLVCGDRLESVTAFFISRLKALGIDHRILERQALREGCCIRRSWHDGRLSGSILHPDWRIDLEQLTGVYFRNVSFDEEDEPVAARASYPPIDPQIASLLNGLRCKVANRPADVYSNRSKPYQALIIREFGFKIPKTLVTNDPSAAADFYAQCEERVIFKSVSGVRSAVRRMNREDFSRLAALEHGPTQFQEYLPGDNIRVHVIGGSVFATRIQSQAVDYRFAGQEGYALAMVPTTLPESVTKNCIWLANHFGLEIAGIDLKETLEGEYYCFEVNTSPAFPFYESPARPMIADALARYLAGKRDELETARG